MNTKIKLLVGGVATVAVLGGAAAAGLAYANPTEPAPTPSTSSSGPAQPGKEKGKEKHGGLLGRALHGEATVKGGKQAGGETRVVVFQRGTVTKLSATSIELRSEDGFVASYVVTGDLRVRANREQGQLGDVKVDQRVRLLATKDGSTLTAKRVIIVE